MSFFDMITTSPEKLAEFLSRLVIVNAPWDDAFHEEFCSECDLEDCDGPSGCPHQEERGNPLWWLKTEIDE